MSLADEVRLEHRLTEIYDLAVAALVVDFGISFTEAAQLLLSCAAKELTPGTISETLKREHSK